MKVFEIEDRRSPPLPRKTNCYHILSIVKIAVHNPSLKEKPPLSMLYDVSHSQNYYILKFLELSRVKTYAKIFAHNDAHQTIGRKVFISKWLVARCGHEKKKFPTLKKSFGDAVNKTLLDAIAVSFSQRSFFS